MRLFFLRAERHHERYWEPSCLTSGTRRAVKKERPRGKKKQVVLIRGGEEEGLQGLIIELVARLSGFPIPCASALAAK